MINKVRLNVKFISVLVRNDQRGATMLEYALLASLLGVASILPIQEMQKSARLTAGDAACILDHVNTDGHGLGYGSNINSTIVGCPIAHCRASLGKGYYRPLKTAEVKARSAGVC